MKSGSFSCNLNSSYLGGIGDINAKGYTIYFSEEKPEKAMFQWQFILSLIEYLPAFINEVIAPVCQKASENAATILFVGVILVAGGILLTSATPTQNEVTFDYEQLSIADGSFNESNPAKGFDYHYQKHVVDQHEYDYLISAPSDSQESKDEYRRICKESANKDFGEVRRFLRKLDNEIIIWDPSIEQVVFMNLEGKGDIDNCFIPDIKQYNPRFKYIQNMLDQKEIVEILPV